MPQVAAFGPKTAESATFRADQAFATFLLQREQNASLRATDFAAQLPPVERANFLAEARAMSELDDLLCHDSVAPPWIGGYRIHDLIGQGGCARVFEAEQVSTGNRVALKLLHRHLAADARSCARLDREARIARSLAHPGIVRVLDFAKEDHHAFLVMELVPGVSLQRQLELDRKGGPASANARAWLSDHRALARRFADVADALHSAHQQGVCHRDLKPSNLMVGPDGSLTVLDFGLCSSPDMRLTRSSDFLGTPIYMSPEQAAGHHEGVGPRSDVYSLGAVLYECVTGKPTVADGPLPRVLDAVRAATVPCAHRGGTAHRELSRILARCLAKQPGRRYADAASLAEDLRAFAAGQRTRAAKQDRWRVMRASCLVVMLGLLGFSLWAMLFTASPAGSGRVAAPVSPDGVVNPRALLPEGLTRSLVELARQGDEALFVRELERVLNLDGAGLSQH